MSDVEETEYKTYREDKRIPCRYGAKCYQKNAVHHEKYKHPPVKDSKKGKTTKHAAPSKKRKKKDDNQPSDSPKKKIQKKNENIGEQDTENDLPALENNIIEHKDDDVSSVAKDSENNNVGLPKNSENLVTIKSLLEKENITINHDKISLDNAGAIISCLFLMDMPDDFLQFYEFCKLINEKEPLTALRDVHLQLVGPYDVFGDKFLDCKVESREALLRHWRYYYDPPEYQTVVRDDGKDGLHYGYWRDDISENPVFVARNKAAVNCLIEPVAENLFGTLDVHVSEKLKMASPFEKTKIAQLQQKLRAFAKEREITLDKRTAKMHAREKKVVTRTFHKAGIVVPYNKRTELGYRDLAVTDNELQKILKQIDNPPEPEARRTPLSKLEEVIRLATIAADECDFGTVLELGHDLFSSGVSYVQSKALNLLSLAYNLLQRETFLKIAQAHLKDRRRGLELNVLRH